jgi:phage tail-like protein
MTSPPLAPGWLADQLPHPLADDHLTRQLLRIFEDIGASVRQPVVSFAHDLDVELAPMEFIRWMGEWLALAVPTSLSDQRQRDLLAAAGATWQLRGTRAALARLLETITGEAVEIDDGGGVFGEGEAPPNLKRVVVDLAARGGLTDEQILEFVRREVPANVVVELRVGGRPAGGTTPEPSPGTNAEATAAGDEPPLDESPEDLS